MPLEKVETLLHTHTHIYIYLDLGVLYITHERLKWKRQLMGTCTTAATARHVCGYPTRCPACRYRRRPSPAG